MINIIIFSCVCLTAALFLLGFMCHHVLKMSAICHALDQKIDFMNPQLQVLEKNLLDLKEKMSEQQEALSILKKTPASSVNFIPKETIEQNYERAKKLITRGMPLDRELMLSCGMTEEEFELLADGV